MIDNATAARIGRRHGLGLVEVQALAAMAYDEAEANDLAASFASDATQQFDDALREAVRHSGETLR